MICKVKNTIEKNKLLEKASSVCVGVSAGADSMCLLHILSSLKDEYGIILKVVHINHNIRGEEALRDQRLVEDYCCEKDIPCLSFSFDVPALSRERGLGIEECGRLIRYECFNKAGCDLIATAHSLSDSIETMLFNLARGTGMRGLCGIPVRRDNIIRPLIDCTRGEIEDYCRQKAVPFVTDSTNLSDDYTRNFIRHNIVEGFRKINSDFEAAFLSAMSTLRAENSFLHRCALLLLETSSEGSSYSSETFLASDPAVRRRALSLILKGSMNKDTEKRHIDLAEKALLKGSGRVEIAANTYFTVRDGRLFTEKNVTAQEPWQCTANEKGEFITPYGVLLLSQDTAVKGADFFDGNKIKNTLVMSSRRQGDSFYSKKRDNTKTLRKLFIEAKIPSEKRNAIAVLHDGDNVVWVEGFGTDGRYLPDEDGRRVYIIKKEG